MDKNRLEMLKQIAGALAAQFGSNCEVVIHDLTAESADHPIVHIENGHISGRKVGDGPSRVVLEHMMSGDDTVADQLAYLTRTQDGKILKSSTMYMRDERGHVDAIFSINYDISALMLVGRAVEELVGVPVGEQADREKLTTIVNVNDMLDELIDKSVELVGRPVAMMNKEDKIRAIQFLSRHGAFLITKSGDKVAKYFGISKYTLYSYIDAKQEEKRHE